MAELGEELPPGTGIIDVIRAERHPFFSFACEVIDNSFDAQSTKIRLIMTADKLQVSDNGIGITRDREQALVKLAQHEGLPGTSLGRYGIGLKYKAIAHGDSFKVVSTSLDGRLVRSVDWERIRRSGKWIYPFPTFSESTGPTGTEITISQLRRRPTERDISKTLKEVQRLYYPALEAGKTITLNGGEIAPIAQPELRYIETDIREFPGGRIAVISGGLLADPKSSKLHQVDLVFDYRVIKAESLFGCDGYGGTRSMFARIDLSGPWHLTKYKDDLADDPYEEELERWAATILGPILKRCSSDAMCMKSKLLEQLLNDMLPADVRTARPEQTRKLDRVGEKRGRQGIVKSLAEKVGPAKGQRPPRGIKIEFADNLNEQYGYGHAIIGKSSSVIQLAADNPTIRLLMAQRDVSAAKMSLFGWACLIFQSDIRDMDPQLRLRFFGDEPIGLSAWKMGEHSVKEVLDEDEDAA